MTNERFPDEFGPDDVPGVYASICKGECLEPMFRDGACIVFSKSQECKVGDFVGVWLHPDAVADGEHPRRVKKLAFALMPEMSFPYQLRPGDEIEPMVILDQLNPPERFMIRASRIIALHKVIGEAISDGTGRAQMHRQWINGQMMTYHPEPPL